MTAMDDIEALGGEIAALREALTAEKADHSGDVEDLEWWKDRALAAEQELRELHAVVEASTAVDLLARYRRVCAEKAALLKPVRDCVRLRGKGLLTDKEFVDVVSNAVRVSEELS